MLVGRLQEVSVVVWMVVAVAQGVVVLHQGLRLVQLAQWDSIAFPQLLQGGIPGLFPVHPESAVFFGQADICN